MKQLFSATAESRRALVLLKGVTGVIGPNRETSGAVRPVTASVRLGRWDPSGWDEPSSGRTVELSFGAVSSANR